MMDWRMEAKGVTPMPVATRMACSAAKMEEEGAPCGPSTSTSSGGRERECVVVGREAGRPDREAEASKRTRRGLWRRKRKAVK